MMAVENYFFQLSIDFSCLELYCELNINIDVTRHNNLISKIVKHRKV